MNIQHLAPHIVPSLQSHITSTKFRRGIRWTVDPLTCVRSLSFMARIVHSLSKEALGIGGVWIMGHIYSIILTERGPALHSLAKTVMCKGAQPGPNQSYKYTPAFFTIAEIRPCVISSIALTCPNGKSPSML